MGRVGLTGTEEIVGLAGKDTVVQVAPVLPEDARQQAGALAERGLLQKLVTSWVPVGETFERFRDLPVLRALARRRPAPVRRSHIHRVAQADVVDKVTRWTGGFAIDATDRRFALVDRVAARWVRSPARVVLGREDGCLASFQQASSEGIWRLYDLPTPHHATVRRTLERESAEFPDVCTISINSREFSCSRIARKDAEVAAADFILCPSRFVSQSVVSAGVPQKKVVMLPLGAEHEWTATEPPLRDPVFLYVGQISLRKGVHRLLHAWKRLKAYQTHRLRLIGSMRLSKDFLREFAGMYEHVPFVPRDRLVEEYSRAQALVFNALADGFGMVVLEAMVCGTPALVSENSGAAEMVSSGENGVRFPYGNDDALMAALDWALGHPAALTEMGRLARCRAAEWTWIDYRRAFGDWVQTVQRDRG